MDKKRIDYRIKGITPLELARKSLNEEKKNICVNLVQNGDILITNSGGGFSGSSVGNVGGSLLGIGDLVGHAAIIVTDGNVLEMVGGNSVLSDLQSNNTLMSKEAWFYHRKNDDITVYRCPDVDAANDAADWAYWNYYSSTGGLTKTRNISYQISSDIWSTNPSYCSKLVLQAYHMGTGCKDIIDYKQAEASKIIVPTKIPDYFKANYKLKVIGRC